MSGQIEVERSGDVLTIGWSRRGRFMAALYRGLKLFPLIMGGLAIFFTPDYFFRYAEEEPVTGLFWGSLAGLALLITFLASTLRLLRKDQWIFDGAQRTVVAEVQTLWGKPARGEAQMRDLEALLLRTNRWPKRSELKIELDTGEREVVLAAYGLGEEIESVADEILEFLREQRYHVELKRGDGEDGREDDEENGLE